MRYFIVSDVHSFFSIMKVALDEKGFDPQKDTLIVDGDLFDRGNESLEMFDYIYNLPNKILIRGNHEYLLLDLYEEMKSHLPIWKYHYTNGTVNTILHLSKILGEDKSTFSRDQLFSNTNFEYWGNENALADKIVDSDHLKKVLKWIKEEFVNYAEIEKYVITHSWIPTDYDGPVDFYDLTWHYQNAPYWKDKETKKKCLANKSYDPKEDILFKPLEYDPKWKKASKKRWIDASWGCPYLLAKMRLNPPRKTIVCGHWSACDFHYYLGDKSKADDIYFGENVIAIDACTGRSQKVNVLVIEDGKIVK